MTTPGLFDDPRARAIQEHAELVGEEKRLLEEWSGLDPVAPDRRSAIDLRLREIRTRLVELRKAAPPAPARPRAPRRRVEPAPAIRDGRMAATGERD